MRYILSGALEEMSLKQFKMGKDKINIKGLQVRVSNEDYICLTDIAKSKDGTPNDYIRNWLQAMSTIRFLAAWEEDHNPNFNTLGLHCIEKAQNGTYFYSEINVW